MAIPAIQPLSRGPTASTHAARLPPRWVPGWVCDDRPTGMRSRLDRRRNSGDDAGGSLFVPIFSQSDRRSRTFDGVGS